MVETGALLSSVSVPPACVLEALKARAHRNQRSLEGELRTILTAAAAEPEQSWRCFHCGDVFTNQHDAAAHFGLDQLQEPGCVAVLRHGEGHLLDRILELEQELAVYRAEESDIVRWQRAKQSDHAQALAREEEKGYARGLRDAYADRPKHPV